MGIPPVNCAFGAVQVAAGGVPAHANDAPPVKSAPGVNCKLKSAVCPAVTVTEVEPGAAGEIAKATLTMALRATLWGELELSSVMVTDAARAPVATGDMETPMVQVVPAAYAAAAQLFVKRKSLEFAPTSVTEAMCSGPVPEFARVMTWAGTTAPCVTGPKETLAGVSFTIGVPGGAAAPVPANCTDCGESAASSMIVMLAVRWPAPIGENVTLTLQVPATGTGVEQGLLT